MATRTETGWAGQEVGQAQGKHILSVSKGSVLLIFLSISREGNNLDIPQRGYHSIVLLAEKHILLSGTQHQEVQINMETEGNMP